MEPNGIVAITYIRVRLAIHATRTLVRGLLETPPPHSFSGKAAITALLNIIVGVAASEYGLAALGTRYFGLSDRTVSWLSGINTAQIALGLLALFAIGIHRMSGRGPMLSR